MFNQFLTRLQSHDQTNFLKFLDKHNTEFKKKGLVEVLATCRGDAIIQLTFDGLMVTLLGSKRKIWYELVYPLEIIETTANVFFVKIEDVVGESQQAALVAARQVAALAFYEEYNFITHADIAR